MKRTTLHIIGGESRSRAEQARIVLALGHHAEVYSAIDEVLDRPPREGILLVADDGRPGAIGSLIADLIDHGIWLPVVAVAAKPSVEQIVTAIKAGALDYFPLPLEMGSFARSLDALMLEAGQYVERRQREVEARRAIGQLSRREREVLELLSAGCANKEIARRLAISPRTVEIHRSNMMSKLAAGHLADAVHLWTDAQAAGWRPPGAHGETVSGPQGEIAGRIDRGTRGEDAAAAARSQRQ